MNNKNLLITFGCSWTYGVGVNYQPGMPLDSFQKNALAQDLCDSLSFRGILSSELGLDNVNFASGGSSNQRQFRLAQKYFISKDFFKAQKTYKNITVLWGITSTARTEMYDIKTKQIENFYLDSHERDHPIAKQLVKYCYDHEHEIRSLSAGMKFWNIFFENLGITNFWFDTFNHHEYSYIDDTINNFQDHYKELAGVDWPSWQKFLCGDMKSVPLNIVKEIYRVKVFGDFLKRNHPRDLKINRLIENSYPRDLASYLAIKHSWSTKNDNYHHSVWQVDCDRIKYLTNIGLLNPWSNHPTAKCHEKLAEFFKPYVKV